MVESVDWAVLADHRWHEAMEQIDPPLREKLLLEALDLYSKALQIMANRPELYAARGLIFHQLGDEDKAIADYTAAISIAPEAPDFIKNRAIAYERRGDLERALADYEHFLTENSPPQAAPLEGQRLGAASRPGFSRCLGTSVDCIVAVMYNTTP